VNLFPDTIIRWRGTVTVDRYGNPTTVWDETGKTALSGVSVQPDYERDTTVEKRVIAVTGLKVLTRPGKIIDVKRTDRILWGERDGTGSLNWWSPAGEIAVFGINPRLRHAELKLKIGVM
jgi:hypothetical protein